MPIHSMLQSTITCISAKKPPREAAPMRVEAADAIEAKDSGGKDSEYTTAIDGRKLRLAEHWRGTKPRSECRAHQ
jgi:hypothetical protein